MKAFTKKKLSLIVCISFVLTSILPSSIAYASDGEDSGTLFLVGDEDVISEETGELEITNEPSMPELSGVSLYAVNNNTMASSDRAEWINEIIEYSEDVYEQEVVSVTEDENYITFHFDPTNYQKMTGSEYNIGIEAVSYLKPEKEDANNLLPISNRGMLPMMPMASDVSTAPTKLIYYYGWSGGYEEYDSVSGVYGAIASTIIQLIETKSLLIQLFLQDVLVSLMNELTPTTYVQAWSKTQYYYRNKAVALQLNGYWYPTAYAGLIKGFAQKSAAYRRPSGKMTDIIYEAKPEPLPDHDPTNISPDYFDYSAHYYDEAWLIAKARQTYGVGGYWEAFGPHEHEVPEN